MWTEGAENLAVYMSPGDGFVSQVSEYIEPPVWSTQPHVLLLVVQEEVDRGDEREVCEIGEGFWKVFSKRGFQTVGAEVQGQRCPRGNTEVIRDDDVFRLCGDFEDLEMRQGYNSPIRSVGGRWNRILEYDCVQARGTLEEVEELSDEALPWRAIHELECGEI